MRDAILWSCFKHKHVIELLGVFHDPNLSPYPTFVTEWTKNGDIITYLSNNPTVNRVKLVSQS